MRDGATVRAPDALQANTPSGRIDIDGHLGRRTHQLDGDELRALLGATLRDLLGEGGQSPRADSDGTWPDERSAPLFPVDEALLVQQGQGMADRDPGGTVSLRQLRLSGHRVGDRELTRQDPCAEVIGELAVERLTIAAQRCQAAHRRPLHAVRGDGGSVSLPRSVASWFICYDIIRTSFGWAPAHRVSTGGGSMRKLRYGAIGLAGLVASSVGGVVPVMGQSPAPVTISYLTHWGPDQVAQLQAVADAYHAQNPNVTVEIRAVPFGDLLTTIKTQASSPGGPSIAGIYNLWLPELARDEVVAPAPEANVADITANWPASAVAGASVDGVLYGYPNEINTYALNYNKRLFAEAGITAPPATWDELIADAKLLTKKDGDTITQQGFGLINSWAAGVVHPFYSLLASDGGDIVNGTTPTLVDRRGGRHDGAL